MNVKEMIGRLRDLDKIIVESPPSIYAEAADLLGELLEENARLKLNNITAIAGLEMDMHQLRKDAERYRWLREHWDFRPTFFTGDDAELDAAIDAALEPRK
jgi:hypothetical protein